MLSVIPLELVPSSGRPLLGTPGPDLSMAMMSLAHTRFQPFVTPHGFLFMRALRLESQAEQRPGPCTSERNAFNARTGRACISAQASFGRQSGSSWTLGN